MASATDKAASLTVSYPCTRGLSRVIVNNRKDCCAARINKFKLSFVKSLNGVVLADFTFTGGLASYNITGPNP